MAEVTIRELRNHGGDVIDRVERGERLTVTRNGKPVAELRPLPRPPLPSEELVRRWRRLQRLDPAQVRREIDELLDPSL